MDSDLDPNAFLKSVRELKEKRQKEDNERYQQLEAQIAQDREMRQARQLERERSLSPEKTTPQSSRFGTREGTPTNASPVSTTTTPLSPSTRASTRNTSVISSREGRESPATMDRPPSSSNASPGLSRSGTLSWQQRPKSISVRSRPLSTVASENNAARSPQRSPQRKAEAENTNDEDKEEAVSKEKIAQSLGSKDPAWFRQTADRGLNSPAYRSNRDDQAQEDMVAKRQLPGMSPEAVSETAQTTSRISPPPETQESKTQESASPSRFGSVRGSAGWGSRPSSMASISEQHRSDDKTPLPPPLDFSTRFPPPSRERSSTVDGEPPVIGRTMSNAQTRISTDRPVSPTKGMGGFVQSAFMKRTDSVNKRWSATPGASLNRQDSTASIPSRFGSIRDSSNMASSRSMPRLDQSSAAPESESRPGSSHSTISNLALGPDNDPDKSAKPTLPRTHSHSRSKSVASLTTAPDVLTSPPLSPSKRWSRSPTKASWLESALARPESPKPSQQSQPSWMADITKAKQQRNSGEATLSQDTLDAARALDNDSPGPALLKKPTLKASVIQSPSTRNFSPPTKAKPTSLVGRPTSLQSMSKDTKTAEAAMEQDQAAPSMGHDSANTHVEKKKSVEEVKPVEENKVESEKAKEAPLPAPSKPAGLSSPFLPSRFEKKDSTQPGPVTSPKPSSVVPPSKSKPGTLPTKDFRAGLKPRLDTANAPATQEPEFKAMFGKLKKAQAEKYVAPDELKNNIVRGKAGLSISAGPQKSARKDELRESLIMKKDEIKTKAADPESPGKKISPAPPPVLPEALAIKKQLGRTNSTLNVPQPPKQRNVTPEALSLHKTLRGKQRASSPEKRGQPVDGKNAGEEPSFVKSTQPVDGKDAVKERSSLKSTQLVEAKDDVKEPSSLEDTQPVVAKNTTRESLSSSRASQQVDAKQTVEAKDTTRQSLSSSRPAQRMEAKQTTKESFAPLMPSISLESSSVAAEKSIDAPERSSTWPEKAPAPLTKAEPKPTPASSKFADRFNPALAGILARGPPSNPVTPRSGSPASTSATTFKNAASDEPSVGGELTHMTKNRAKGPKRRKPIAKVSTANAKPAGRVSSIYVPKKDSQAQTPQVITPSKPAPKSAAVRAASYRLSSGQLNQKPEDSPQAAPEIQEQSPARSASPTSGRPNLSSEHVKTKPTELPQVVPEAREKSPVKVSPVKDVPPVKEVSSAPSKPITSLSVPRKPFGSTSREPVGSSRPPMGISTVITADHSASATMPEPLKQVDDDKENEIQSSKNVKSAASMWEETAGRVASQKRSSPIQLPTRKDEEAAMRAAGLLSTSPLRYQPSPPRGLGISGPPVIETPKRSVTSNASPAAASTGPPRPTKSSRVVSASLSTKDLPSLPEPRITKAGRHMADYFGDVPSTNEQLLLDTQSILTAKPSQFGKIKTLRKSIQEIRGDGKLIPLPAQEEYILYENSMYICTHVFGSTDGAKMTEVYLWAGAGVPEPAIQDATLFGKKIAKEAGGGQKSTPLSIIDQNREPPAFFQALGGIIIVRRGSRAESSGQPYMLCGRPHMGNIAFDEVDLSKASLCSDFPYIVSRPVTLQETKIYLWKGKSCGPEAIGSARLIGMDLSSSGEIIEVEEGNEPQDVLLLMSDLRSPVCHSPELWTRTMQRWEGSTARLFRISAAASPKLAAGLFSVFSRRPSWGGAKTRSPERPMSVLSVQSVQSVQSIGQEVEITVKELSPFAQTDLEPEGCFVMDCGPTILVLPGPLLSKQPHYQHVFTQALLFAHDYVIMSASMEDRPAMPAAKVVLSGMPRDAQLRFRRWDKARGVWGTGGMMAGKRMDGYEESDDMLDIREALEVCCER